MTLAVVVAAAGPVRAAPFWAAIADWPAGVEIHVVASDPASLGPGPRGVTLRARPGATIFALWGHGVAATSADHVAILDIHCPPQPGWLEAVVAGLAGDPDCACGPVAAPAGTGWAAMLGYLVEYVQFDPPVAPGMAEIPGNNLVVRRTLARRLAGSGEPLFVKTDLLPLLDAPPLYLPGAAVRYAKAHGFAAYLRRRFDHGRSYAAQRTADPMRRLGFALVTPALPLIRVARIRRHAAGSRRTARAFARLLLPIVMAETAWSLGELLGYALGASNSARPLD